MTMEITISQHPFEYSCTLYCEKIKSNVTYIIEACATETLNNELYVNIGKIIYSNCSNAECIHKGHKECPLYIHAGKLATQAIEQKLSQDRLRKKR